MLNCVPLVNLCPLALTPATSDPLRMMMDWNHFFQPVLGRKFNRPNRSPSSLRCFRFTGGFFFFSNDLISKQTLSESHC